MNARDRNGQEEEHRAPQIGPLLEKKRRELGLSLKDVEHATKIRARYLDGLEREDYSVLPDAVYVQGFLKTYANFLGLDGERLSSELKDQRGTPRRDQQLGGEESPVTSDFDQPLITPGDLSVTERRRVSGATLLSLAIAVLVLAVVAGGLYLIGARSAEGPTDTSELEVQKEAPPEPESASSLEQTATEPTSQASTTPTSTPTSADTVRVTVRVSGGSSGLDIYTDGTLAYSQVAQSGFSQTFEARNAVTVSAANAGVISVSVDGGNPEPLGNSRQGATRTFNRPSGG